ncbi:MAG: hypothetical protein SNJ77_11530 [Cytophagales bacterium]
MAIATLETIEALRQTAKRLKDNAPYQWGHMGACNCGNLAQVITPFSKAEIHKYAVMTREGDWNDMLEAYCPSSELPMDMMIAALINKGFTIDDLKHLEYLSDANVLKRTKLKKDHLKNNVKEDVILYLDSWADMLEEELFEKVKMDFSEVIFEKASVESI